METPRKIDTHTLSTDPESHLFDDLGDDAEPLVVSTLEDRALAEELEEAAPFTPPRDPFVAHWAGKIGRHHTLLMLLTTTLLWLIVGLPSWRPKTDLRRGDSAPRSIVAPHAAFIADHEETDARRREAAALVPPVYEADPQAQERALLRLEQLVAEKGNSNTTAGHWSQISRVCEEAIRAVYRGGQIRSDVGSDLYAARSRIAAIVPSAARRQLLTPKEGAIALSLAQSVTLPPNLLVDERATNTARRSAQNQVHDVMMRIEAGDVLVNAGETLSSDKWTVLQDLDIVTPHFLPATALAQLLLCALLVALTGVLLATLNRPLLARPAALWLTAMTPVFLLLMYGSLSQIPHADLLLVPLAATGAILLTILLDVSMGFFAGFLIAALGVFMTRGEASLFLTAVLTAWIGALACADITSRSQLVRAGALVSLMAALLTGLFLVVQQKPLDLILTLSVWSAGMGVLAVVLGAGLAMLLERPFGITTHLRLMELLSPEEKVLRRMQTEAPGTYTHSIMVSLLGEDAAKAVGGDSLLCRVGGLYHDIGKLRRPYCFIENQSGENVHDRISPQLSARLIVSHVRDGLSLARALRLPRPVQDIIAQHHGTSCVEYFYRSAISQREIMQEVSHTKGPAYAVEKEDFRYPGPRPRSKEAAIILLADTIEASSRALPQPTPEKLALHVHTMIAQRLREGELDECELTQLDLRKIEERFMHFLKGALHHRIEYPAIPGSTPTETPQQPSTKMTTSRRAAFRKKSAEPTVLSNK